MSMYGPWDLEERVQDALATYVKNKVAGVAQTQGALKVSKANFPLVIFNFISSRNNTEDGMFTGRRTLEVEMNITTEAMNFNGGAGTEEKNQTADEHHRQIKSSVIGALAGTNTHKEINAVNWPGVNFSQVFMTDQKKDADGAFIITTQTLLVLAQPKEL